jgi:hypothetical protein
MYPIPVQVNKYLSFFLHKIRPLLLEKHNETKSLWINKKGKAVSDETCRVYLKEVTSNLKQTPIATQKMRLCINHSHYEAGPHDPENNKTWNYMMDHSEETEKKYYQIWDKEKWCHQGTKNPHPFIQPNNASFSKG